MTFNFLEHGLTIFNKTKLAKTFKVFVNIEIKLLVFLRNLFVNHLSLLIQKSYTNFNTDFNSFIMKKQGIKTKKT